MWSMRTQVIIPDQHIWQAIYQSKINSQKMCYTQNNWICTGRKIHLLVITGKLINKTKSPIFHIPLFLGRLEHWNFVLSFVLLFLSEKQNGNANNPLKNWIFIVCLWEIIIWYSVWPSNVQIAFPQKLKICNFLHFLLLIKCRLLIKQQQTCFSCRILLHIILMTIF